MPSSLSPPTCGEDKCYKLQLQTSCIWSQLREWRHTSITSSQGPQENIEHKPAQRSNRWFSLSYLEIISNIGMQSLFLLKHLAHLFTYVHLCLKGNRHSGRDPVAVSVPPLWVRFIELQMPSCPLTMHIPAWEVATIAMPDDTMWSNVQRVICIKNHYRKLSHFRLAEQFAVCKTQ